MTRFRQPVERRVAGEAPRDPLEEIGRVDAIVVGEGDHVGRDRGKRDVAGP